MDQIEDQQIETEQDADALLESVESSRPKPDGESFDTPAAQAQSAQPQVDEWDLTVGGKQIKAKREQIMQWAQMGYDSPNKIRSLSKELESWKQKEAQYKALDEKYGPVDKFVREKPDFWDHVLQSYEQRNQSLQDQSNPLAQVVSQLQSEVQNLVQYKNQVEERQSQVRAQQEDSEYLGTLESIRKSHPDVDFVTPDAEGKTLEYKVLEYANENGIKNFKTAFRDFYFDELTKRAESKAKENLVKEKQKNTKLGVLGTSSAPTKQTASDHRGKSWDDLSSEIKAEYGLT